MDILKTAIDAEGGVGKLASVLGVGQNVVSNWRARGLPKPWDYALRLKYAPGLADVPAPMGHQQIPTNATQEA